MATPGFYGGHSTGYKLGNHPKNIEPCAHRARTVRAPCDNAPHISLWDVGFGANTERFQGLVPFLPHLYPLSVPKGGGYVGIFGKPLKRVFGDVLVGGGVRNQIFSKIGRYR